MSSSKNAEVQERAVQFEKRIITFLNNLKFDDVAGGTKFIINGKQVDAVAGHEDYLLVFECTLQKNVRSKIEQHRGNIKLLKEGFKTHPIYKKYKKFIFILSTYNNLLTQKDKELANKPTKMILWDKKFLEYYEELFGSLGKYAKYNLLGDLQVKPRVDGDISFPAFSTKLGDFEVYNFFIDPRKLLKVSYVARREVGKESYYQRLVKNNRLKQIGKYISEGGFFPNNIIISFEDIPKFSNLSDNLELGAYSLPNNINFGVLHFPNNYRSAWIIDGQHRLYSYKNIKKKDQIISVMAFKKLSREKQAEMFIDINEKQKAVDSNLIWDLEGQMRKHSKRGKISNIVKKLNDSEPFKDKIYIPLEGTGKRKKFKLTNFCVAIDKRKLAEITTESKVENPYYSGESEILVRNVSDALITYFTKITSMLNKEANEGFLLTNAGISVMLPLFERIISLKKRKITDKDIENYFLPLSKHLNSRSNNDLKEIRGTCASEGGRKKVFSEFALIIRETDKTFAPNVELPTSEILTDFEIFLRKNIIQILKQNNNWFKEDIPAEVQNNGKGRMRKNKGKHPEDYFDIGDCMKIIDYKKNWNIFKSIFEKSFRDKSDLQNSLRTIKYHRDKIFHGHVRKIPLNEEKLIDIYFNKLKESFSENEK